MYLSKITVQNFRCLQNVTVDFRPGLNVILGENNTGKTALIDAIRLVLTGNSWRREPFPDVYDLCHDSDGKPHDTKFEIHATLADLSPEECGLLSSCLAPSLGPNIAQVHFRFEQVSIGKRARFRPQCWGGETEGESVPSEAMEGIRVVHLEALRDAQVGLRPGKASRIARLLQLLAPDEAEQARLTAIVETANQSIENDALIAKAKGEINTRLKGVTGEFLAQTADLKLTQPEFRRITESLRALVGAGEPFEIDENGLGYNNLLYIATVLGELQQAKVTNEIDLAVLLIEEPEAHLHPHLQTVLVDYLERVGPAAAPPSPAAATGGSRAGAVTPSSMPVQVFVTSHSPVLASHAPLDSVNLLYLRSDNKITSYPLAQCTLSENEKKFMRRFLDVTKAQLFFAKGVVFVEGVSEALLIAECARKLECDLSKHGVSVINVQGLAFAPFAKLFQENAIAIPASIISDGDPGEGVYPEVLEKDTVSATAKTLLQMKSGKLDVFLAAKTFEYDLALAGNARRMCEAYKQERPMKGVKMEAALGKATTPKDSAVAFLKHFDPKDKAVLAQVMTLAIAKEPDPFFVPGYLAAAIRHATGVKDATTG